MSQEEQEEWGIRGTEGSEAGIVEGGPHECGSCSTRNILVWSRGLGFGLKRMVVLWYCSSVVAVVLTLVSPSLPGRGYLYNTTVPQQLLAVGFLPALSHARDKSWPVHLLPC